MPDLNALSLPAAAALFAAAAVVALVAGVRLTRLTDRLADLTGLGEAVVGGVILGAITSLSGGVTSVTAAAQGHAELAVSNAIGGIAAQTVFLVIADWRSWPWQATRLPRRVLCWCAKRSCRKG